MRFYNHIINMNSDNAHIMLYALDPANRIILPLIARKNPAQYKCPECKKEVILINGDIRRTHFRHKPNVNCGFYDHHPNETVLHNAAKTLLRELLIEKIPIKIRRECMICENTADFCIDYTNFGAAFIEYSFDPTNKRLKADVAMLSFEDNALYLFEICHTNPTNPNTRPSNIEWFEISALDVLKCFEDNNYRLKCLRKKECGRCKKGKIYFNQRGAGCGKTYESVQLINKDKRFAHKNTFIYLTKMNSAKSVVFGEHINEHSSNSSAIINFANTAKQYAFKYQNNSTTCEKLVIVGTIDSFTYALHDKTREIDDNEYFRGILKLISDGHDVLTKQNDARQGIKRNMFEYAHHCVHLGSQTLIIVDESQDLSIHYLEALNAVRDKTCADIYVIGDKLQSIFGGKNIYTQFEDLFDPIVFKDIVEISPKINKVMRFHNVQFIEFVNKMIDFNSHNLPPVQGICDRKECPYEHENDVKPYHIIEMPNIYEENVFAKEGNPSMDAVIMGIIKLMGNEVSKSIQKFVKRKWPFIYTPNNFMLIFPLVGGEHTFLRKLQEAIQEYWVTLFDDEKYISYLSEDWQTYLKNSKNKAKFHVKLHKSEDNKPINLDESKYMTRMLSIHASKGSGCEVVFALGMTSANLKKFTNGEKNLQFDSLLHVAITRQKKSLYFGLQCNYDEIHAKIEEYFSFEPSAHVVPEIQSIKKTNVFQKLTRNMLENKESLDYVNNFIKLNEYNSYIERNNKHNIDWGHHIIRRSVIFYSWLSEMYSNDQLSYEKAQFQEVIRKNIIDKEIVNYPYDEYNKKKRQLYDFHNKMIKLSTGIKKAEKDNDAGEITRLRIEKETLRRAKIGEIFPLLLFGKEKSEYWKIIELLEEFIKVIQNKFSKTFQNNIKKLPNLCPMETIIVCFMYDFSNRYNRSNISIMELYEIMLMYSEYFKDADANHHGDYSCLCKVKFSNMSKLYSQVQTNPIFTSIIKHHECVSKISSIYEKYQHILSSQKIKINEYHTFHSLWFNGNASEFRLAAMFDLIGHSNDRVIFFAFKPTFGLLNYKDIIKDCIFNAFCLMNQEGDSNGGRYAGKHISACVVSLDCENPIWLDFVFENNDKILVQLLKNELLSAYCNYSSLIHRFYHKFYPNEQNIKGNLDAILLTIKDREESKKDKLSQINTYKNLPKYIQVFFKKLRINLDNEDKSHYVTEILKEKNIELFKTEINLVLKDFIDGFLDIKSVPKKKFDPIKKYEEPVDDDILYDAEEFISIPFEELSLSNLEMDE